MQNTDALPFGNQVRIISYGPFRGLNGTILQIDMIVDDLEQPFCFYLIALEKASFSESLWFEYNEVEFIGTPSAPPSRPAASPPLRVKQRDGHAFFR